MTNFWKYMTKSYRKKKEKYGLDWINKKNMEHCNNLQEFKSVIKLTPEQFEELLFIISPIISRNDTFMFRVSKSSISNMILDVCDGTTIIRLLARDSCQ